MEPLEHVRRQPPIMSSEYDWLTLDDDEKIVCAGQSASECT
ncbi:hypothetical protein ACFQL1_02950 [Halomicroarcula sp. GCM10025709]|nr:hypothetical protein [Halomicroarcula sp. YJ-61-S]